MAATKSKQHPDLILQVCSGKRATYNSQGVVERQYTVPCLKRTNQSITDQICSQNFRLENEVSFLGVSDEIVENRRQIFVIRAQVCDVEDASLHERRAHAHELDAAAAVVKVVAQVPVESLRLEK